MGLGVHFLVSLVVGCCLVVGSVFVVQLWVLCLLCCEVLLPFPSMIMVCNVHLFIYLVSMLCEVVLCRGQQCFIDVDCF